MLLRLAQALASGEIYASPEPKPRLGPPVPRLPAHDIYVADGTPKHAFTHDAAGNSAHYATCPLSYYALPPLLCVRPVKGTMGDVKSRHCRHEKVLLPRNAGPDERPQKRWPRLQTGSSKGKIGQASDPLHQGWLCTINKEDHTVIVTLRVECPAVIVTHRLCILGVKNSIYTRKTPPSLETIKREAGHQRTQQSH